MCAVRRSAARACVCACVRERERERVRVKVSEWVRESARMCVGVCVSARYILLYCDSSCSESSRECVYVFECMPVHMCVSNTRTHIFILARQLRDVFVGVCLAGEYHVQIQFEPLPLPPKNELVSSLLWFFPVYLPRFFYSEISWSEMKVVHMHVIQKTRFALWASTNTPQATWDFLQLCSNCVRSDFKRNCLSVRAPAVEKISQICPSLKPEACRNRNLMPEAWNLVQVEPGSYCMDGDTWILRSELLKKNKKKP